MNKSGLELRALIGKCQKEVEEISHHCLRSGYSQAARDLSDAMNSCNLAKLAIVAKDVQTEKEATL